MVDASHSTARHSLLHHFFHQPGISPKKIHYIDAKPNIHVALIVLCQLILRQFTGGEMKARVCYTDSRKGSKLQDDTPKSFDRNVQDDTHV